MHHFLFGFFIFLALILGVCVSALRVIRASGSISKVYLMFLSYTLLFSVSASIGRACVGIEYLQRSAYITYLLPALVAVYFLILGIKHSVLRNILAVALIFIVFNSENTRLKKEGGVISMITDSKIRWINCYLNSGYIDRCFAFGNFYLRYENLKNDKNAYDFLNYLSENKYSFFREEGIPIK